MNKMYVTLALLGCCAGTLAMAGPWAGGQSLPLDDANGLVGTAPLTKLSLLGRQPPGVPVYSGFTSPGAELPFSSTDVAPINVNMQLSYPIGPTGSYYYPNFTMYGFSSGGRFGPMLEPVVGDWTVPPQWTPSLYNKATEVSSPGYYAVDLATFRTKAELTATTWTALYRFTFPKSTQTHILLSLGWHGGKVEIVGNNMVRGVARARRHHGSDLPGNTHFIAEFSTPFTSYGTFRQVPPTRTDYGRSFLGRRLVQPGTRTMKGHYAGSYVSFDTHRGQQILVKVAHGHSYAEAARRLHQEDPDWNFNRVHARARAAWAGQLDRIQVQGGTQEQRTLFYSCLLHALASPRLLARKGESFTDMEGHEATARYDHYGPVALWDSGRNQIVLLMLLRPKLTRDILRSELYAARESGYMETSFSGDNAVFLYLGAWERGVHFNWRAVYKYLRKNATDPNGPRAYLQEYMDRGWISDLQPSAHANLTDMPGKSGVAKTLQYSWDDHALAVYAKRLGLMKDYKLFLRRSRNYENVFDSADGFMRGRSSDGKWLVPFNPTVPYYHYMFLEGSGWSYLWLVPYDVQGLISLLGGRKKFDDKLDEFFDTPYHPYRFGYGDDFTGVIGQYVQGDQPDWQAPYYYDWGGQPWKTQRIVRKILRLTYGGTSGYAFPGMDDSGSMSAWYVFSAMGFYPVDPSSPNYIIGSPIFNDVKLHLGDGKVFEIMAKNNSAQNMYIQSATLNGEPWNKPWFSQSDIAGGGRLVLVMGPRPNKNWGSAPNAAPPSMSLSGH